MPESERRALPLGWIVAIATTVLVVGGMVTGIIAYRAYFNTPSGMFMSVWVPTPFGSLVFERGGVSFERPPKFSERGIEEVQVYVEQLTDARSAFLGIYLDKSGDTGFSLISTDSSVDAVFVIDKGLQPGVESRLRSVFEEEGKSPASVETDSGFTWLEYRVDGSPEEVSRVIERVLVEAYGVSPDAGLYFQFDD